MAGAIDRRSLIRRGIVVGGAAWTAPILVQSVLQPAGAITGKEPGGCYKLHVRADTTCLTNWDTPPDCGQTDSCNSCCDPSLNSSDACPTGWYTTTSLADFGIGVESGANSNSLQPATLCSSNIDSDALVVFTSTLGCTFTAAAAHLTGGGLTGCFAGSGVPGTVVTFTRPSPVTPGTPPKWNEFHLCVNCP